MLELRKVDRYNFRHILQLCVHENQQAFVPSNAYSLAQAYVQPEYIPLAIYKGGSPIGFAMYCLDVEEQEYWIDRLMIDRALQSRGYGRQALELLLDTIKKDRAHHTAYLCCHPDNTWGRALYESLGFRPDGRVIDGEPVYRLDWEP